MFSDTEIADRITTGDVIVDLQRPYDNQAWWASVSYGKAAYYAIFRGVPPFVVGAIAFDLQLPSIVHALAFVASVAFAVGVAFGWRYLAPARPRSGSSTCGAPTSSAWLTAQFLSGAFVPIVFFPGWLETVARALPFAAMVQLPVEVWLGRYDGAGLAGRLRHPAGVGGGAGASPGAGCCRTPCAAWWCRVAEAMASLGVWRRLVGARIRADWQYRTSFFLFLRQPDRRSRAWTSRWWRPSSTRSTRWPGGPGWRWRSSSD